MITKVKYVIPGTQEVEVGGSRFKNSPGKSKKSYLKKKLKKQNVWGHGSSDRVLPWQG
jgi:hypothetical protein